MFTVQLCKCQWIQNDYHHYHLLLNLHTKNELDLPHLIKILCSALSFFSTCCASRTRTDPAEAAESYDFEAAKAKANAKGKVKSGNYSKDDDYPLPQESQCGLNEIESCSIPDS
ncbi:hypothetical protein BC938DRAFT_483844 [Jimgerdemannia flammicorona]|uniref:Uncharacterized protein n=1 Tax=Jimgerdemannia flammicorona TaxID=994334 RepID=A0A433QB49_9FUNG|nr:hypothetical protein BC938DRAFT_483844 [Jimgerdemannia flammicorona]